jgi:hypothetical protein
MVMVQPSATGDWVIVSTSQLKATSCIQVPARDTSCPNQNSR